MGIIIDSVEFDYDVGCKVLKLKYGENCPIPELNDIWADIVPIDFAEICTFNDTTHKRVAMKYLDMVEFLKNFESVLISSETITKETLWVDENNNLIPHKYEDTYSLYRINGKLFGEYDTNIYHYIRFKDTSGGKDYILWIGYYALYYSLRKTTIDAIDCIAWTIQTKVPKGDIVKIVRQGDCILIKPKNNSVPLSKYRHLTRDEYMNLLEFES